MLRLALLLALASATRQKAALRTQLESYELYSTHHVANFLPVTPPVMARRQPVGIPFGAKPAKPGERSSWRYSLFRQVRKNAFGATWKAFDTEKVREVNLALYSERVMGDLAGESAAECEKLQSMLAGKSSYPQGKEHICKCLEAQESDADGPYLVMEDCGFSLVEKLREQWREPRPDFVEDVRKWMRASLEAIAFMSGLEKPTAHFDLRPWSIAVNDKGEVKLVDFWVAGPIEDEKRPWSQDIYDLGAIYYDLLCRDRADVMAFNTLHRSDRDPARVSCEDGGMGIGTPADWAVVKAMLVPWSQSPSPDRLMKMLDAAR